MSDLALDNASIRRDEVMVRLAKAKQAVAQAQSQVQSARDDLDKIDQFIALWHEFAGVEVEAADGPEEALEPVAHSTTEPRRGKRPRGNPKKELVAQVSREIIDANGAPMLRAPLFAAVRERGLEIKGADPEMVFSTMLWRMPETIIRLPEVGYWLVERPYAPVNYMPGAPRTMIDKEEYDMAIADGTGQLPDTDGEEDDSVADYSKVSKKGFVSGQNEVTELREKITAAKHAYKEDRPIVSDAQYDEWQRQVAVIEQTLTTRDKVILGPPRPSEWDQR